MKYRIINIELDRIGLLNILQWNRYEKLVHNLEIK